ncbi:hypothetical protein PYW08_005906 [Mythimna loreyi]|uniref:Uncharacterized protein n=1 Tax=Mythimna loreyi TaxID=667449 RepID=A0ACC2QKL2_9NEOP|nr:hypothetical protein PYW08_005906 [Mythimna loreyi]
MPVKIYKIDSSPPARVCVIVAELLKLDYTTQDVNLLTGEHLTPEYLEKNPMHTVPVLEDGDFVLADSHAIMAYLISKYGTAEIQEKLYPSDLQIRATIQQRMFFETANIIAVAREIVYNLMAGKEAPTAKQIEYMNDGYSILEKYLEKSKFVACDHFTIADLSLVAVISSTNVYVPVDPKYTKIHAWWNLLKEEDWYKNMNQPGLSQYEEWINSMMKSKSDSV